MLTHTVSMGIRGDLAELFAGGFEVVADFLGENVRVREVIGLVEALASEPGMSRVIFSRLGELSLIHLCRPNPELPLCLGWLRRD